MFYHIRPNHKPQHSMVVSFKRLIMWSDIQIISYTVSVSYRTYTENAVIYQLSQTVFAVAQGLSLAVKNVQNKGGVLCDCILCCLQGTKYMNLILGRGSL